MMSPRPPLDLRLYVLVDADVAGGRDLAKLASAAVQGGATLIQYRDKSAGTRLLVERTRAIRAALAGTGVPLLVNDRADVALAAGADGAHLGQDDLAPTDARRLLGPAAILGRTVKTAEHALALATEPVDYACIGGVFATGSKHNPDPPVGLDGLARLARLVRTAAPGLPVGAIAGIGPDNARATILAGADGIAVVSAIIAAPDPESATRALRAIVDAALRERAAQAQQQQQQ